MVNINSIEGIESLIDKKTKPLKEEILKLRFELDDYNKALTLPCVVKPYYCGSDHNHNAGRCKNQCRLCSIEEKKGHKEYV